MAWENTTIRLSDGDNSVVIDTRHWPVVFATWLGVPTEELVKKYFAEHAKILERARTTEQPFILVTDTFATQQPTPKARKLIADLTAAQPETAMKFTLESFIVIESVLIRGVVTALRWILPRMSQSASVDSMSTAIERAFAALDAKGIKRPAGLSAREYRRPSK